MNAISNQTTPKSPLRSKLLCAVGSALILGAGICVSMAPALAVDEKTKQALIDASKDRNWKAATSRPFEDERIKRLSDRLKTLKESATRPPLPSPGDAAHEELGVGDAGLDARPSRDHDINNPLESYGNDMSDHQDHNDARRPGHGLSNAAKGEALANGSLGRGNLGHPSRGGVSSADRGQNNAGTSVGRLRSEIDSGNSNDGGTVGGLWADRVATDIVKTEEQWDTGPDGEPYLAWVDVYYDDGATKTDYYDSAGRRVATVYREPGEEPDIVYFGDTSPMPHCNEPGGQGCPSVPVPPEVAKLLRDVEGEYDRSRLHAAITREHTGQPTPSESPVGVVDGEGFPGRNYTSGTDRDCVTAKCNSVHDLSFDSDQLEKGLQMRGWAPQHAPQ